MTPTANYVDRKSALGTATPFDDPKDSDGCSVYSFVSKGSSLRENIIARTISNDLNKNPFGASKTTSTRAPMSKYVSVPAYGTTAAALAAGKQRSSTMLSTPSSSGNSTRSNSSSTVNTADQILRTRTQTMRSSGSRSNLLRIQKTGQNDATKQKALMEELHVKLSPYMVRMPSAVKAFSVQKNHSTVLSELKTKVSACAGNTDSNACVFLACANKQSLRMTAGTTATAKKSPVWG